jgi:hypothetical protein
MCGHTGLRIQEDMRLNSDVLQMYSSAQFRFGMKAGQFPFACQLNLSVFCGTRGV